MALLGHEPSIGTGLAAASPAGDDPARSGAATISRATPTRLAPRMTGTDLVRRVSGRLVRIDAYLLSGPRVHTATALADAARPCALPGQSTAASGVEVTLRYDNQSGHPHEIAIFAGDR